MSSLLAHDEGPFTKMSFAKNKQTLAGKVNEQSNVDMKSATMQRVIAAKGDQTRSKNADLYGNNLRM